MKNLIILPILILFFAISIGQQSNINLSEAKTRLEAMTTGNKAFFSGGYTNEISSEKVGIYYNYLSKELDTLQPQELPKVYPNPVSQVLTVQLPVHSFELLLFDDSGKMVFANHNVSGSTEINCMDFPNGMYYVIIIDANTRYNQRIMVKNDY